MEISTEMPQVYIVMAVVLAHAVIDIYLGYTTLVRGWGDEVLISIPPKLYILGPALNAFGESDAKTKHDLHDRNIVALCVQNFFVWRIWIFKKTAPFKTLCVVITMVFPCFFLLY